MQLIAAAGLVIAVGIALADVLAYLRNPVLSSGTKGALIAVTVLSTVSASAHLHFTLLRWLRNRRITLPAR